MKLTKKLNRPYYFNDDWRVQAIQSVLFGLFVVFFLEVFQPFQIDRMPGAYHRIILGFGLVTTACMLLLNVLLPLFPFPFYNGERWTVGTELIQSIANVTLIGLANFLYFGYAVSGTWSWAGLLWFQFATWAVALLPLSIVVFVKEGRMRRRFTQEAEVLSGHVRSDPASHAQLVIHSENHGDAPLAIDLAQLRYIRATGNYVEVHYSEGSMKRTLIRSSLKKVEEEMAGYPQLFRCHKSYLVNLDHVRRLSGNAQGYRLHLNGVETEVPVSRQHHEEVKARYADSP